LRAAKQVSGRIVGFYRDVATHTGIAETSIFDGTDIDPVEPPKWLEWERFCMLNQRLEELVGGPGELEVLGPRIHGVTEVGLMQRTLSMAIDPRTLFWVSHHWSGPAMFPELVPGFADAGPGRLRLSLALPPHYADSPQFFRLVRGFFATLPRVAGLPDAAVELSIAPREGVYEIVLPPGATWWQRLLRAWRVVTQRIEDSPENQAFRELVNQQRALESEVRDARQARDHALAQARIVEHAAATRESFLSRMSHELRTPLGGIIGTAQLLLTTRLDRDQEDFVRANLHSAQRLDRMVGNVLDFGALERGAVQLTKRRFSPRELLEAVATGQSAAARDKGLELALDVALGVPSPVKADRERIAQVLTNLAENAVVFSKRGAVVLRLRVTDRSDDGCVLAFEVEDEGPGVPAAKRQEVFEPFAQVDETATRSHDGAGLGLALSRLLARAMDGDVTLRDAPGGGTIARFEVPVEIPPRLTRRHDQTRRALIADDSPLNRAALTVSLRQLGYQVETAKHGREALKLLLARSYDVAIIDIYMPVMSGLDCGRAFRRLEADGNRTPMIAFAALGHDGLRRDASAAGFDEFLTKPVDRRELSSLLETLLPVD